MTALYLARHFARPDQLHTVLLVDALRWSQTPVASVFSPAFRTAAQLALRFKIHTLQLGAPKQRATA